LWGLLPQTYKVEGREMKKSYLFIWLLLLPLISLAAPKYEEDIHYSAVIPEQPGGEGQRVKVMEFFWYGCIHCYKLEPHLKSWLQQKPGYVDFVRVPATLGRPIGELHAKTFYALKLMQVDPSIHEKIFHAVQEEGKQLASIDEMAEFLGQQGVDTKAYRNAMSSFAVQTQARRAGILAQRFDVRAVPALGIDGKYLVSGLDGTTTIEVMNHLIERVRQE
jgi:thiol:disulfide interchange protein DsbA